jgi:DHA2 family multidrug resistance protein
VTEIADEVYKLRWWILLTVIIGTFLGRLDQTIVNLALPKIIGDFGITVSQAGWIATAYIIANAIFVPVWGKLGDTIGRKKVYILGFSIFIFGSVLAGLSWNLNSLLVFRVIQAIAGSADYPTAMAILAVTFRAGKERAQALGIWSASFAAAVVFGPLLGGPLIDNFGWRSVFLINLPIGLVGIIMAVAFVHESIGQKSAQFDWWGAITLGAALSSLVLVLEKGRGWGWLSANSVICYAVIAVFAGVFYFIDKTHPEPIIDFKFFKHPVFTNTLINNFIVFMGMMGSVFLIPVFASTFLGLDSTHTGYLFIPMAVMMMLSSQLGGRLVGRVQPRYVIMASTLLASVGLFLFSVFLDPRASAFSVMIPLSIFAFGMGFGMAQRTSIIASIVPEKEIGIASSILALARNIAGAFGIAIFATILDNSIESNLLSIAKNSVVHATTSLQYGQAAALMILKAQMNAYHTVFLVSAAIVFIGGLLAWFIDIKEMKSGVEVMVD